MHSRARLLVASIVALLSLNPAVGVAEEADKLVHLNLHGHLTEKPHEDPFGFSGSRWTSLKEIVELMDKIGEDPEVAGAAITLGRIPIGFAQMEEIHRAIRRLQDSGKRVDVHLEDLDMATYTLFAPIAELSVVPVSSLWLTGLSGHGLYLKETLAKLGVEADFLHVGGYKSAGEIFTRTDPSPEAEENMNWLLDSLFETLVEMISESRDLEKARVVELIDRGLYSAELAKENGLISHVEHRDEFLARVKGEYGEEVEIVNRYDKKSETEIDLSNPFAFFTFLAKQMEKAKAGKGDAVGLVYIEGPILPGYEEPNPFGASIAAYGGNLRKALEEAAEDDSVKAVVIRVDSPGGSAQASEVIHRAVLEVKEKKPVVVSMGNMAASGGYYVSCGATRILADKTTLTGSIGVVGGKLVTAGMWDKVGVNWHEYKRGANSDLMSSLAPWRPDQRSLVEGWMQDVYEVFTGHVVAGRGDRLVQPIEEVAGGRVYTGAQALELGLIDEIGGLSQAIAAAAELASATDYEVRIVPEPVNAFVALMEEMSGGGDRPSDLSLTEGLGASPWLPLLQAVDPERIPTAILAIHRLELISREGLVLMPPFDFAIR